ncbi:hypothetical protein QBC38DRAFT_37038 [Podospora fimiseda]|uniref:Uncharacterized protein n=1 Tax=Podospora fimiseda TaxID=252190 RepID=A0AAN7BIG2_9PEZI|nr:hypothetical protein QBC38DRAFT_37038 [Podospora fimiseda]
MLDWLSRRPTTAPPRQHPHAARSGWTALALIAIHLTNRLATQVCRKCGFPRLGVCARAFASGVCVQQLIFLAWWRDLLYLSGALVSLLLMMRLRASLVFLTCDFSPSSGLLNSRRTQNPQPWGCQRSWSPVLSILATPLPRFELPICNRPNRPICLYSCCFMSQGCDFVAKDLASSPAVFYTAYCPCRLCHYKTAQIEPDNASHALVSGARDAIPCLFAVPKGGVAHRFGELGKVQSRYRYAVSLAAMTPHPQFCAPLCAGVPCTISR